jgi:hypothetical protein
MKYGYARVSTGDQNFAFQLIVLRRRFAAKMRLFGYLPQIEEPYWMSSSNRPNPHKAF